MDGKTQIVKRLDHIEKRLVHTIEILDSINKLDQCSCFCAICVENTNILCECVFCRCGDVGAERCLSVALNKGTTSGSAAYKQAVKEARERGDDE
jgi:hypothetical protein